MQLWAFNFVCVEACAPRDIYGRSQYSDLRSYHADSIAALKSGSTGSRFVRDCITWDVKLRKVRNGSKTATFTYREPRPLFQWYLLAANARRSPPLISECICMQQLLFTACTEPHPLICCCCRSSTPAIYQGIFTCSRLAQSYFHLYSPCRCVCKLVDSHTYQSIEISICLLWVYIARYLQHVVNIICERVPQFTNPSQQLWPDWYNYSD